MTQIAVCSVRSRAGTHVGRHALENYMKSSSISREDFEAQTGFSVNIDDIGEENHLKSQPFFKELAAEIDDIDRDNPAYCYLVVFEDKSTDLRTDYKPAVFIYWG